MRASGLLLKLFFPLWKIWWPLSVVTDTHHDLHLYRLEILEDRFSSGATHVVSTSYRNEHYGVFARTYRSLPPDILWSAFALNLRHYKSWLSMLWATKISMWALWYMADVGNNSLQVSGHFCLCFLVGRESGGEAKAAHMFIGISHEIYWLNLNPVSIVLNLKSPWCSPYQEMSNVEEHLMILVMTKRR